jgi:hypothetical protein
MVVCPRFSPKIDRYAPRDRYFRAFALLPQPPDFPG